MFSLECQQNFERSIQLSLGKARGHQQKVDVHHWNNSLIENWNVVITDGVQTQTSKE